MVSSELFPLIAFEQKKMGFLARPVQSFQLILFQSQRFNYTILVCNLNVISHQLIKRPK